MKQVDFFKLERSVQDRFLSASRAEFDPKPILFKPATVPTGWYWLAISPISLILMWALYATGLGDMDSSLARHATVFIGLYVGLAVAFAVGIVQFIAYRAAAAALPYRPGYYLFPACLIDARTTQLRVTPISEMSSAGALGAEVVITIAGTTMRFPSDHATGETVLSAIKLAQMQCSDDLEDSARVMLDPLAPPVVKGPFANENALVERKPLWMRIRFVAAVAFGVVGVLIYQHRDSLSDDQMFATAKDKNDVATYKRYLERGTEHKSEVSRLLLPRAELKRAIEEGSVEAIDAFKAAYPDTDIASEVEAARKRALEVAFNKAAKPATLDALFAFEKKYPGHHLGKHLAAHKNAIYKRALDTYKSTMMPKSARSADFAGRLVAYSEKKGPEPTPEGLRGPEAEVRIRVVPSKALKKSDELVRKNQYYAGKNGLPSRWLNREEMKELEDRTLEAYRSALDEMFPPSILRVKVGEEVDGTAEMPPFDKPTLVISYRIEPSGKNYASAKPRGIFVGLAFFFRIEFFLPGDDKPYVYKEVLPKRVPGSVVIAHAKNPEGSLTQKIYAKMTNDGFDAVTRRFLEQWLKPELLDKP